MHHRLIVLTDRYKWINDNDSKGRAKNVRKKEPFKDSKEVRQYVEEFLHNQGFDTQLQYASGPADWLMIGGRWSGELTSVQMNPLLWKACSEELNEKAMQVGLNSFHSQLTKDDIKKGMAIFKKFFPRYTGPVPLYRDEYRLNGYEDDAQIVSKKLWLRLIEEILGKSGDDYYEDPLLYLDGSIEDLSEKKIVNKMWAVVVDYHN